jgi:hypothetical protein
MSEECNWIFSQWRTSLLNIQPSATSTRGFSQQKNRNMIRRTTAGYKIYTAIIELENENNFKSSYFIYNNNIISQAIL